MSVLEHTDESDATSSFDRIYIRPTTVRGQPRSRAPAPGLIAEAGARPRAPGPASCPARAGRYGRVSPRLRGVLEAPPARCASPLACGAPLQHTPPSPLA